MLHKQLREQQQAFARFINQGSDKQFAGAVRANGLTGERRLGIYRHGVMHTLKDALSGVYEVVNKLVGDAFFGHLAEQYVFLYPSHTGNLHDYGFEFAEFLSGIPGLESLPYLPDVARLEWYYHAAFHSPMGEMLNIQKLSTVPDSKYEQLSLLLSPACFLLSSDFPVLHIWQANQDDNNYRDGKYSDEVISLDEGGAYLAIVREGKQVAFHPLEPAAFAMLDAISRGETFAYACDAAIQKDSNCIVGQYVQDAVMQRIITGFAVNE